MKLTPTTTPINPLPLRVLATLPASVQREAGQRERLLALRDQDRNSDITRTHSNTLTETCDKARERKEIRISLPTEVDL